MNARFERKAKTISSPDHPHVCTLYDVGREGDADYVVMELVDGETQAARIARGALLHGSSSSCSNQPISYNICIHEEE